MLASRKLEEPLGLPGCVEGSLVIKAVGMEGIKVELAPPPQATVAGEMMLPSCRDLQ